MCCARKSYLAAMPWQRGNCSYSSGVTIPNADAHWHRHTYPHRHNQSELFGWLLERDMLTSNWQQESRAEQRSLPRCALSPVPPSCHEATHNTRTHALCKYLKSSSSSSPFLPRSRNHWQWTTFHSSSRKEQSQSSARNDCKICGHSKCL